MKNVVNIKNLRQEYEEFIAKQSGHTVLLDKEKEMIFKKILVFFDSLEKKKKLSLTNGEKK